jgi:hypothetical protein
MWKRFCAVVLPVAAVLALMSPADAGSSVPTGTIALAPTAQALRYGGFVSFVTTVQGKLAPKSRVYVTVVCLQGSTAVYQYSSAPDFAFPLVDQPSEGLEWNGGSASCTATLIYKVPQGRTYAIYWLDQTAFDVTG